MKKLIVLCCGNKTSPWDPLKDAIGDIADVYIFDRAEGLLANVPQNGPCIVITSFGILSEKENYPAQLAAECKKRNHNCVTIYYSQDPSGFDDAPFDMRFRARDIDGYIKLLQTIKGQYDNT